MKKGRGPTNRKRQVPQSEAREEGQIRSLRS